MKKTIYAFFDDKNKVTIPIIQRDYAQGRIDKGYIRESFLKNIYDGVRYDEECKIPLDFIYGYKDDNNFYPLDGQQRLTTLWLIYWYLAVKADVLNDKAELLRKFTYQTRVSSREFCEELCKTENMSDYQGGDIVTYIVDQHWFFSEWQDDPTVSSMLRTLGGENEKDGIQPVFLNNKKTRQIDTWRKYLERFERRTCLFEYIIGDEIMPEESADQLYIKMNARGKPLSDFEDFRADLIDQTEKEYYEKRKTKALLTQNEVIDLSQNIDYSWSGIFWTDINLYIKNLENSKNTDKKQSVYDHIAAKNLVEGIGRNTDELFFSFVNRFCFGQICDSESNGDYDLNTRLISLIDAIQDPNEDKYLSETQQRKAENLRAQNDDKSKQTIDTLNQYDYFFNDHKISYEKYDAYKDVLPYDGKKNRFDNLQNVLNALCKEVVDYSGHTIKWAEFIQMSLEECVNKTLRIRQPNSEGYHFLPQYRREIKNDTEENHVVSRKGNIMTRTNKGGINVGLIKDIKLADRIYFFAICKYLDVNCTTLNKDNFVDWLYFCRNVIENASIASVSAMINCIRVLDKYGNHSQDIIEFLCSIAEENKNEDDKDKRVIGHEVGFESFDFEKKSYLEAQIVEEVLKAQKINESKEWRKIIRETEDYSCFCGCIRFLFLDDSFIADWGDFAQKRIRSEEIFFKDRNAVKYDAVKEYALQFKDFEDASEKLIFHTKGWAERGDSWVNVLCNYNNRVRTDKWLKRKPDNIAESLYKKFLNSEAFTSIVQKKGILNGKENLHITKRGERWICVQKSSEYDYLIFDDTCFRRNELIDNWIRAGDIRLVSGILPFAENSGIHIGGGYYWYRDICFKYNDKIFQITSDMEYYEVDEKTGKSKKINACPL